MARINRSDIIQKAVNDLAISTANEKVPNETLDKVQLTYDLNRKFSSFCADGSSSTTGLMTLTMPTIDSRSEIYITHLDYSIMKDATCDMANSVAAVTVTPELQGIGKKFLTVSTITLTAQNNIISSDLAYPLKLKPNTNITNSVTFSVGVCVRGISVAGFIVSSN